MYISDSEKRHRLADLLNRRQIEISLERHKHQSIRQLAREAECPEANLRRYFNREGLPSDEYKPGLARVFGMELYDALGEPRPMPERIDPRLKWLLEHQDNPGVKAVLDQIQEQGEAILSHKPDKSDRAVRLVTFDPA